MIYFKVCGSLFVASLTSFTDFRFLFLHSQQKIFWGLNTRHFFFSRKMIIIFLYFMLWTVKLSEYIYEKCNQKLFSENVYLLKGKTFWNFGTAPNAKSYCTTTFFLFWGISVNLAPIIRLVVCEYWKEWKESQILSVLCMELIL